MLECVILRKQIWQLLTPKMAISKLSGNTVKIKPNYLPKPFDIWHLSLHNRSNWHQIQVFASILFNLTPRLSISMRFQAWSFIKRFTAASKIFWKDWGCPLSENATDAYRVIEYRTKLIWEEVFFLKIGLFVRENFICFNNFAYFKLF